MTRKAWPPCAARPPGRGRRSRSCWPRSRPAKPGSPARPCPPRRRISSRCSAAPDSTPRTRGIALSNGDGFVEAWYGNVLSPADQFDREEVEKRKREGGTFLVRRKASVYLAAFQPLGDSGRMLVHFSRLAFLPQVQSSFIREFHALRPALRSEFDIDYWDFRADVEGFEKFFARHEDEFIGQPRQKNEIQTLFFPLRNEAGRIMATVTLASPSLTSRLTATREGLSLVLILALIIAGSAALAYFWSSPGFLGGRDALSGVAGAALLIGLRLLALPLGHLERVQSLRLFRPDVAGFASWKGLTQSPADIFLTALTVLGLAVGLAVLFARPRRGSASPPVRAGDDHRPHRRRGFLRRRRRRRL